MSVPLATYRLQFNPQFDFAAARKLVGYLADLGLSHIYASPVFAACHGSEHGYDVIAPNRLNDELGSAEEFERLLAAAHARGLGWVQDIVPNHMAFSGENVMLMDVLEQGPLSPYFNHFDIEWDHPYESFRGRVLAPFLGKFYGEALESGDIRLDFDERGLSVNYFDLRFPLRIESYAKFFGHNAGLLKQPGIETDAAAVRFLGALHTLRNMAAPDALRERGEQTTIVKRTLFELYSTSPEIRDFIDGNLRAFNGRPGDPDSFTLLDDLLADQRFRLAFWKVATEEVNYRRFFNINQLISVRVEDERVFADTHSLILQWIADRSVDGLRVDHVDGLYDPRRYAERLRAAAPEAYLVVEKILHADEELPDSWPVHGTTGYDFLCLVNGLFVDRKNDKRLDKVYARFAGQRPPFAALAAETKRLIINRHMTGEVDRLARLLKDISSRDRYARDITLHGLRRALLEILAVFPVYRTYVSERGCSNRCMHYIQQAVRRARELRPALLLELNFVERFLLLQFYDHILPEETALWMQFVSQFQQLTGPLAAKGIEDTALYIHNKLLSLNEVGSAPDRFGFSPIEFHQFNRRRAERWPLAMNATATHDTKRGEDVRARINVLSEIPDEWEARLRTWHKLNAAKLRGDKHAPVPDSNDEYFFYQTLIGTWPFDEDHYDDYVARIKRYLIKAVREAKVHTAWLKPDETYEQGFLAFADDVLALAPDNRFHPEFYPFQRKIADYGIFNSLSQTLLKMTCPGVPDFYQGTELWDLNLVDPDNRRPVNYNLRKWFLGEIVAKAQRDRSTLLTELLETRADGRIKLFTIYETLKLRRQLREVLEGGNYVFLTTAGRHRQHVIAFARRMGERMVIVVAPRRIANLAPAGSPPIGEEIWQDTSVELPKSAPHRWRQVFSGNHLFGDNRLMLHGICADFPLGLLVAE